MKKAIIISYKEAKNIYKNLSYNLEVDDYVYIFYIMDLNNDKKKYYNFGNKVSIIYDLERLYKFMIDINDDQFNKFKMMEEISLTKKDFLIENNLHEWAI